MAKRIVINETRILAVVPLVDPEGRSDSMFVQPGSQYDAKCRFSHYKEKSFENPSIKSILAAVGLLEK